MRFATDFNIKQLNMNYSEWKQVEHSDIQHKQEGNMRQPTDQYVMLNTMVVAKVQTQKILLRIAVALMS